MSITPSDSSYFSRDFSATPMETEPLNLLQRDPEQYYYEKLKQVVQKRFANTEFSTELPTAVLDIFPQNPRLTSYNFDDYSETKGELSQENICRLQRNIEARGFTTEIKKTYRLQKSTEGNGFTTEIKQTQLKVSLPIHNPRDSGYTSDGWDDSFNAKTVRKSAMVATVENAVQQVEELVRQKPYDNFVFRLAHTQPSDNSLAHKTQDALKAKGISAFHKDSAHLSIISTKRSIRKELAETVYSLAASSLQSALKEKED